MSDESLKQLGSYKAQLQQVEAALSTDPENEDLLKLQKDLQEVLELTKDLLSSQPAAGPPGADSSDTTPKCHSWKAGDSCMAVWSVDGQWYNAEIEEIDGENATAAITFQGYGNAEVVPLHSLKPVEHALSQESKSRKEQMAEQREYKKKKAQRKVQRLKELEQEREVQKCKWQQFNNKAYSKNKKGQVKRSIFASPESVNGKDKKRELMTTFQMPPETLKKQMFQEQNVELITRDLELQEELEWEKSEMEVTLSFLQKEQANSRN